MVRKKYTPDANRYFPNFIDEMIACAPLKGNYYEADRNTVYQALVSFTTGQPSEDWLNAALGYRDGRRSVKAIRNPFAGEVNSTRNIYKAEQLRDSIHYKNERLMAFEIFITKCQKMYNIF